MKCPRCGKETLWEQNPFRPFCSERCKLIDLGKWINGSFILPGESLNGDKDDEG
ncbi:MAG: DNA gyrase inhibitor YacG [Thermodesulfobacteriota bacterium]|nr:DNA gyrase inhibitor YacG [Thermodesulfobacteriota bacterium]